MENVEIKCRCKDCTFSNNDDGVLRCYFWAWVETRELPQNKVEDMDFCSNAILRGWTDNGNT